MLRSKNSFNPGGRCRKPEHVVGNIEIPRMPEGDLAAAAGVAEVKQGRVAGLINFCGHGYQSRQLHLHYLNAVLKRALSCQGIIL